MRTAKVIAAMLVTCSAFANIANAADFKIYRNPTDETIKIIGCVHNLNSSWGRSIEDDPKNAGLSVYNQGASTSNFKYDETEKCYYHVYVTHYIKYPEFQSAMKLGMKQGEYFDMVEDNIKMVNSSIEKTMESLQSQCTISDNNNFFEFSKLWGTQQGTDLICKGSR